MARRVRGVAVREGRQTGDGRLIVDGAVEWVDPPLPLAWLQQEQHGDLLGGAVQVGTVDSLVRGADGAIDWSGMIDDEQPDGAEMVRRMEGGTAPMGARWGVSIDPDNWQVEIVATDAEEGEGEDTMILVASGSGPLRHVRGLTAAAGDPDTEDGVVLFEDECGAILERYTRLRIRGLTACAIPAFDDAFMELDGTAEGEHADEPAEHAEDEAMAAVLVLAAAAPVRPPAAWFAIPEPVPGDEGMVDVYGMPAQELLVEQPDGGLAVPLTITADGRVFGHAARWGQCHIGYPGSCVTAPESASGYAHYHVGEVVCAEGGRVATGTLTVGCDHAAAELLAAEARDHYAHAGLAFADVRASNGALGVWVSGALRPTVTDEALRLVRASAMSGDWRRIGAGLEYIATLAVNVPGFPIAREAVTAAALSLVAAAPHGAAVHLDAAGVQTSLVASGIAYRCPECQRRALAAANGPGSDAWGTLLESTPDPRIDQVLQLVRAVEMRTRHLTADAAEHLLARMRRS